MVRIRDFMFSVAYVVDGSNRLWLDYSTLQHLSIFLAKQNSKRIYL